jgi:hypothetical protein
MQGDELLFSASGFKGGASAVLYASSSGNLFANGANVTLQTDGATSGKWARPDKFNEQTCPNQINVDDWGTMSGTDVSLYLKVGCGNTLAAAENLTLTFIWGNAQGAPMYLSRHTLMQEIDGTTKKPKQTDYCKGIGPAPTTPPQPVASTTYNNLILLHRWLPIISWGFLFPLGVSLVRHYPSGSRLKLHRYIQCLGLLVEIVNFISIVTAHQIGWNGLGPAQGDDNFEGAGPTPTHKQRGLAVFICIALQVIFGLMRPAPYPNDFKRRLWLWCHRVVGDGGIVIAWIQIWESVVFWKNMDEGAYVRMCIVMGLFMASSAIVVPVRLMFLAAIKDREMEEQGGSMISSATPSFTPLNRVIAADAADGDHPRDAVFFGCAYCNQVFTGKHILEVHIQMFHQGCEYKDIQSPMTQKFAEVCNNPVVNDGIPLSQVRQHDSRQDCWVAINGKVYDLTSFLKSHPGGANPILAYAGRDASKAWNQIHQKSWLDKYASSIECLGVVGPEPPVPGMATQNSSLGEAQEGGLHLRQKNEVSLVTTAFPSTAAETRVESLQTSLMTQP